MNGQSTKKIIFKHLSVDDGLSQSWVRCFCQDKQGFIWIGTDDGLNRYDGYNVKVYKNDPQDKNLISSNCILSLLEDKNGNLWIGTLGGLNLYDRVNDRFVRNDNWPMNNILSMAEDELSNLWVATGDQLYYLNTKTNTSEPKSVNKNLTYPDAFKVVYVDRNNNVWIGRFKGGLLLYNKNDKSFTRYEHDEIRKESISHGEINVIFEDSDGKLWVGTESGLDLFLNANQKVSESNAVFKHYQNNARDVNSISSGAVFSLVEDNYNNLWIGTENGGLNMIKLSDYQKGSFNFIHFISDPGDLSSLNNNSIRSLLLDKQNNIWIGTFGKGLNIINPGSERFILYRSEPFRNSLTNNHINVFYEDGDNIWIGTEGGLNVYNTKNGNFSNYIHDPLNPRSLSSNAVYAICKDAQDRLWIGTWAGGLNLFDRQTNSFRHYRYNPNDSNCIGNDNVFSIIENTNGDLIIGTVGGGLTIFNPDKNTFKRYNKSNSSIFGDYIEMVTKTSDGSIWLENGNPHGQFIEYFDPQNGIFKHFIHKTNDSASISSLKVNMLFEDSKGNFWVATDAGLNLFNKKSKKFTYYQQHDGLPDNSIKSILEDNSGNLWLGTNKGLSKFVQATLVPQKAVFKNYTTADGLQSNEFCKRSCLKSKNGTLYFGGINGFNKFLPDSIKDYIEIPPVVITELLIFNKPVTPGTKDSPLDEDICIAKRIKLSYTHSVFSFKFAAINFILQEKVQYAYMLEGFESNWNHVGNKREATYTNLDPGKYIFRVKASSPDGIWGKNSTSIEIIIIPPWWKTWWVKTLLGICFLGIIVFIVFKIISEFKISAHQSILNERKQLNTLINNIPDQIVIKDNRLRYVVVNNSFVTHFKGKNEDEFLNKTDFDFFPREIAESLNKQDLLVLKSGLPLAKDENTLFIDKNKEIIFVTKCPLINPKGETIGLVCIMSDITESKKAELKILRQSEDLMRYNKELNHSNNLLEERQHQIQEQASALMAQKDLLEEKQKYIQAQTNELEKNNEQLKILNATKDRFFSIIAHDLRNPFHVVKGFSELILNNFEKLSSDKIKKYIELIHTSSTTGSSLLENLLNWSRSQTGTIAYEPDTLDLYDLVKQTVHFLVGEAQRKNIEIKILFEPQTFIFADANMLQTIFRNLIYNAIKFTPGNGIITISCILKQDESIIAVKDNGIGISKEDQHKIFDNQTMYSTSGTMHEQGTGLGLILCKEFVDRHGGKIWVESKEGSGSEFKFILPVTTN